MKHASAVFACSFFISTTALAAETCNDTLALNPKAVVHGGASGIWFPTNEANRLFFVLSECLPRQRALVASQARLLDTQLRLIETSSRTIQGYQDYSAGALDQASLWKKAFFDADAKRQAAEADLRHWTHSPILWFTIGAVITGALSIGLAFGLQEAGNGSR